MKNTTFIALVLFSTLTYGQVIIGTGKTSPTNTSVSLEFGNENKGIILPYVDAAASVTAAVPGTIIFDAADKKIKVKLTGSWKDLTIVNSGVVPATPAFESEQPSAKVVIGSNPAAETANGILILSDANKAMILPTVNTYTDIVSPSPGMMVYLSGAKQVACYNGAVWSFWK
ncbi:hypothetical protein [Chryseobacterium salivictor]|uniref:Uncharacterized protein n=1 Tax=Chryseobacterium salivictor TaxID=2547600 RepID=A0A4P6ZCV1_9FLAO|nr:hypothetical protein [Chryseobacterium salivictor]QBO57287.1 hypothetical protein NBC122_00438 [Chryseobacterium salivictor]